MVMDVVTFDTKMSGVACETKRCIYIYIYGNGWGVVKNEIYIVSQKYRLVELFLKLKCKV